MGVGIVVGEREPIADALRRFRQKLERSGVRWELRRRTYFVGATEARRKKEFRKRFKARKARLVARIASGLTGRALAEAKKEFWRRTGKP
jgi:ribosomal protein S21